MANEHICQSFLQDMLVTASGFLEIYTAHIQLCHLSYIYGSLLFHCASYNFVLKNFKEMQNTWNLQNITAKPIQFVQKLMA
jgi:hypothetical protein